MVENWPGATKLVKKKTTDILTTSFEPTEKQHAGRACVSIRKLPPVL